MEHLSSLKRDPRFEGYLLFDNPPLIALLIAIYLYVVLKLGPDYMKSRKPYKLQLLIRIFNLVQVVSNVYFVSNMTYYAAYKLKLSPYCPLPIYGTDYDEPITATARFYFYVRMSDFLDTLFFVLQKKQGHVSVLHVYHHVCVVANSYIYMRYGWASLLVYLGILNGSVHIVMYSYYFLSTFKSLQPYLWWKKYITTLQLAQFCVLLVQGISISMHDCGYPKAVVYNGTANAILFLILFAQFYINTYKKKEG